jgi:hypothetical protein
VLPASIMGMFRAAFEDGAINPGARPTARLWHQALTDLEASLQECRVNTEHFYPRTLRKCPWCQHEASRTITQQALPRMAMPSATQVPLAPATQPTTTYAPPAYIPAPRPAPNVPFPVMPVAVTTRKRSGAAQKGMRAILIGAGLCLVAGIAIPAVLSSAGSNSANPGTSTSDGSGSDQAAAMNSLLQDSSGSRVSVDSNVKKVQNCSDVPDGTSGLQRVVSERRTELSQANNLSTDAMPNGAALKSDLIGAIKNSLAADNDFLSWAQGSAVAAARRRKTATTRPA